MSTPSDEQVRPGVGVTAELPDNDLGVGRRAEHPFRNATRWPHVGAVKKHSVAAARATWEAVSRPRGGTRPWLVAELAIVLALLFVYDFVRSHAEVRAGAALNHALDILSIERLFHINFELSLNQWLTAHPTLSNAAAWYYQMTHLAVTLTVLALTYVIAPRLYRRARSALVLCNVIALVIFFV
ncbi:MAG: phosphatase PAP2 family protein, partial [Nocardioidaceae bacterium]